MCRGNNFISNKVKNGPTTNIEKMNNGDRLSNSEVEFETRTYPKKTLSKKKKLQNSTILKCNSSIKTLFSPSFSPHNVCRKFIKKRRGIGCAKSESDSENKSESDSFFDNLDKAFNECMNKINNDEFIGELDNVNSTLDGNFNSFNNKRKESCSIDYDCYIGDSECEKRKKIKEDPNINVVSNQKLKSCKRVTDCFPYLTDKCSDQNKKTSQLFLQDDLCLTLPSNIDKCIECRYYQSKNELTDHEYDNIACRFSAFRQLRFTKYGKSVAGYLSPSDSNENDMDIWLHGKHSYNLSNIEVKISMKILEDIGGLLCKFYALEKKALEQIGSKERKRTKILWKKNIHGVREMCDVCKTSLFNHHWFCGKCGFAVCIDCFGIDDLFGTLNKQYSKKKWLSCSNKEEHKADKLSITHIIPGDSLNKIWQTMHSVCETFNIHLNCICSFKPTDVHPENSSYSITDVTCLDNLYTIKSINKNNKLIKKKLKTKPESNYQEECPPTTFLHHLSETCEDQWDAPHIWMCKGHLLRLLDPKCEANYEIFQMHWKYGRPVIVSGVGCNLNPSLWLPKSFSRDFGNQKNDLINCVTSNVISNHPMSEFWDGFEDANKRLCDFKGNPMLLKLKDWPPSTDFAEMLPDRFQNLMDCLPLKKYTHRNGCLNLASYLPECFVKPDLGPKMYTAYGCVGDKHEHTGTTNLHLDMTDAVNVMIHVAITKNYKDFDYDWQMRRAIDLLKEAGCDDLTMKRIGEDGEIPGALWHIYHPTHADAIRSLLTKVATEQNVPYEEFSDPIHDQEYYLDGNLRNRLYCEYGIKGCTIVQFNGDAVFIPAGAPHQVRNLHNCIKVAEDFVSPENIYHSFRMTQEFRHLSDCHTNHEDKLQIKNIVFHSVKDTLSILTSYLNKVPQ